MDFELDYAARDVILSFGLAACLRMGCGCRVAQSDSTLLLNNYDDEVLITITAVSDQ